MVGLGTVINVILIIVGGFVGLFLKNFLKESLQKSLCKPWELQFYLFRYQVFWRK
ncbi:DUF554 family protein [Escherichia coli]|uniref:DUF554 family protein n=1 Tax=Escherichia coli TaxID=562 RepID=UPI0039DFF40F